MSNTVETKYFGNGIVGVVEYDPDPEDPREDENLAKLACWHRHYYLGDSGVGGWGEGRRNTDFDEKAFKEQILDECGLARDTVSEDGTVDEDAYDKAWGERADELIEQNCVVLPLYLYDHSGISISVERFSCPWDSGQVGYAYVTIESARANWGEALDWEDVPAMPFLDEPNTKTLRELTKSAIKAEVETYDAYLTGQAYGYILYDFTAPLAEGKVTEADLEKDPDLDLAEELDSCYGYLGDLNYVKSEMADSAEHILKCKPEQLKLDI